MKNYFEKSAKAKQYIAYLKAHASLVDYDRIVADDEDMITALERIEEMCRDLRNAYNDFVEYGQVADGDMRIPIN